MPVGVPEKTTGFPKNSACWFDNRVSILLVQTIVVPAVVLTATSAFAHFGSKGPYGGGTVTSYVIQKDTIYVGTANGGVYAATWTKGAVVVNDSILSNWSAKPVGLKSGKIVSLAHTGKYAIAATADSGIFRFSGYVGSDRYWVKINNGLTDLNITSVIALDANTLIAGTSTGGILACIYLAPDDNDASKAKFSASEALDFYAKHGFNIFNASKNSNFKRL